jgi:hypothetical protein
MKGGAGGIHMEAKDAVRRLRKAMKETDSTWFTEAVAAKLVGVRPNELQVAAKFGLFMGGVGRVKGRRLYSASALERWIRDGYAGLVA